MLPWIIGKLGLSAVTEVAKDLPWKWIGIGLLAIGVVCVLGFGYLHVEHLKNDLVKTAGELAQQRVLTQAAEARANAIKGEHDLQVQRLQNLETQRSAIAVEVLTLRNTIADINLEQDLESDNEAQATGAIVRLNAQHAVLDRLLAHESGGREVRPGDAVGSKARQAGTPSAFQRALSALRKNGVSVPD